MATHTAGAADVVRKTLLLVVLVAGLIGFHQLANDEFGFDPSGMLALGFVVLAGYTFGELVGAIQLPHITGYLITGLLLGESLPKVLPKLVQLLVGNAPSGRPYAVWLPAPFDRGVLHHGVIDQLALFNTLAIALIALTAGGELKLDGLKSGFKYIASILVGRVASVFVLLPLFVLGLSALAAPAGTASYAMFEGISALSTLSLSGAISIGAVLAAVSLAVSPAVAVAVIYDTKATGRYTQTVLSVVVLTDVLVVVAFSVTTALAAAIAGGVAVDLVTITRTTAMHLGGSLLVGVVVGGLMAVYLRWVGTEIVLFLVSVVFLVSYLAEQAHLDSILLFITAGFTASNFSREGDALIHQVERLSLPVYVVFFTLTGAHLELDTLFALAPFAIALATVRAFAMVIGVRAGSVVSGAIPSLRRYGWLGFLSQAGVAIALSKLLIGPSNGHGVLGPSLASVGETIGVLALAGVALNEIFGPIALKLGLTLSGDVPSAGQQDANTTSGSVDAPATAPSPQPQQTAPAVVSHPWGLPIVTSSKALEQLCTEFQAELHQLMADLTQGPLAEWSAHYERILYEFQHSFLSYHGGIAVAASKPSSTESLTQFHAQHHLAATWSRLAASQAKTTASVSFCTLELLASLDSLSKYLPTDLKVPIEHRTYLPKASDPSWRALARLGLRIRRRVTEWTVGGVPQRTIAPRALARYFFSGQFPAYTLEPLQLLLETEQQVADELKAIFQTISTHYGDFEASSARTRADRLVSNRREIQAAFKQASQLVHRRATNAIHQLTLALGQEFQAFQRDLLVIGTIDLPTHRRRYSLVFKQRARIEESLSQVLKQAKTNSGAHFEALALALAWEWFQDQMRSALNTHCTTWQEQLRHKVVIPLQQVETCLRQILESLQTLFAKPHSPVELAQALENTCDPLVSSIQNALSLTMALDQRLSDDQSVLPLLDELLETAQTLNDSYLVPHSTPSLSTAVEVPFREIVMGFVETTVTSDLASLRVDLSSTVKTTSQLLSDLERMLIFNNEQARAELSLIQATATPGDRRAFVRDMMLNTLGRLNTRLTEGISAAIACAERVDIREQIDAKLDLLRAPLLHGEVTELRRLAPRETTLKSILMRGTVRLPEQLRTGYNRLVYQQLVPWVSQLFEPRQVHWLQTTLGLVSPGAAQRPTRSDFAVVEPQVALPLVYRRLFSAEAAEVGDVLIGRAREIARAQAALNQLSDGQLTTLAVVGPHGSGKRALISAILHNMQDRPVRSMHLTGPTTPETVRQWFQTNRQGCIHVVTGFHWLISMDPGGLESCLTFMQGLIQHPGRNAWLITAEPPVWHFAVVAAHLDRAMSEVITLGALSPEQLETAILTRHALSGYTLDYAEIPGVTSRTADWFSQGRRVDSHRQKAWFQALHQTTEGLIQNALLVWMASVAAIDEQNGHIRMGVPRMPPFYALEHLPDADLLVLRQMARQGWMTAPTLASLVGSTTREAQIHLGYLSDLGLITRHKTGYMLAMHLQSAIETTLSRRGWLP